MTTGIIYHMTAAILNLQRDRGFRKGARMERLTERKRNFNGTAISKKSMIDREGYPTVSDYASKVLTKLADYEDAEEQGLLLRLPCKVGTIIYKIENNTDACCKCNDFKISYCDDDLCSNKNGHDEGGVFYVLNPQYADKPLCKKQFYEIKEYEMKTIDEIFWRRNDFCKTVFFTRKEAEDKLAEMEGAE